MTEPPGRGRSTIFSSCENCAGLFRHAIGIAGSRCGGLFVNLGTMTKATHYAYVASLGLLRLASTGEDADAENGLNTGTIR
jgi:hypothetical protein